MVVAVPRECPCSGLLYHVLVQVGSCLFGYGVSESVNAINDSVKNWTYLVLVFPPSVAVVEFVIALMETGPCGKRVAAMRVAGNAKGGCSTFWCKCYGGSLCVTEARTHKP